MVLNASPGHGGRQDRRAETLPVSNKGTTSGPVVFIGVNPSGRHGSIDQARPGARYLTRAPENRHRPKAAMTSSPEFDREFLTGPGAAGPAMRSAADADEAIEAAAVEFQTDIKKLIAVRRWAVAS